MTLSLGSQTNCLRLRPPTALRCFHMEVTVQTLFTTILSKPITQHVNNFLKHVPYVPPVAFRNRTEYLKKSCLRPRPLYMSKKVQLFIKIHPEMENLLKRGPGMDRPRHSHQKNCLMRLQQMAKIKQNKSGAHIICTFLVWTPLGVTKSNLSIVKLEGCGHVDNISGYVFVFLNMHAHFVCVCWMIQWPPILLSYRNKLTETHGSARFGSVLVWSLQTGPAGTWFLMDTRNWLYRPGQLSKAWFATEKGYIPIKSKTKRRNLWWQTKCIFLVICCVF